MNWKQILTYSHIVATDCPQMRHGHVLWKSKLTCTACLTSRPEAANKAQLSLDICEQGPDLGMFAVGREPNDLVFWGPTRASSGQLSCHLLKVTTVCSGFSDCRAPICNRQHFLS